MNPTPYQLNAERRLLSCLMDSFANRTVLLSQIPERLFVGNSVLIYRAIEALHKADRPVDLLSVYKYLQENGQAHVVLDFIQDTNTLTSDWKVYASDLHEAWKVREEARIYEELAHDRDIPRAFQQYQAMQAVETAPTETSAHGLALDYLKVMNETMEGKRKVEVFPCYISFRSKQFISR